MANPAFFVPSSPLNRLLCSMPHSVYCSNENNATNRAARQDAFCFPYMQVNHRNLKNWLVFDIDHDNPFVWEDMDLPPPNLAVISKGVHQEGVNKGKAKRSSHLYYAIQGVATSENARSLPIEYMRAVSTAMAIKMDADLDYSGPVAKTPGHSRWTTIEFHNHEYTLGELAEYVDLENKPRFSQGPDLDSVSHSRNCTVFEVTRFYAYSQVTKMRQTGTLADFNKLIYAFATAKNRFRDNGNFTENLADGEIKATAKSIARWTWDRYRGNGTHHGVMKLDKSLPLKQRQSLAAEHSAKLKRNRSFIRIRQVVNDLQKANRSVTQSAVAKKAGLTRQTVAKYLSAALKHPTSIVSLQSLFKHPKPVKLGLHQIDSDVVKELKLDLSFGGKVKFGPNTSEKLDECESLDGDSGSSVPNIDDS